MPRRFLSIWLRHWATDRWQRLQAAKRTGAPADRPPPAERPLVLAETIGNRRRILAADRRALDLGLAPGLAVADAQARVPDVRVVPADCDGDAAALRRLAEWATRFSPHAAPVPPDGLLIDITGCAHLWGGEAKLLDDALGRLRRQGLSVSGAIAGTIGAAWAGARFAAGDPRGATVIPTGAVAAALDGLPVQALRIDDATAATLQRLGLKRIGALYPLPRASLARRFGPLLLKRLDQALGYESESLSPQAPVPERRVSLNFAEPIAAPDSIHRAAELLVERLMPELAAHQLGARRLSLRAYRLDNTGQTVAIGTARASADAAHIGRLLREKLGAIDPGLGIEFISLAAEATERIGAVQGAFDAEDAAAISAADLAPLLDRLANRLGPGNVVRPRPVESHIPERAVDWVPPLDAGPPNSWPPNSWPQADGPQARPRPIRLLPHPEPIEAMAPVPDDPPLSFRWRHVLHRVRRAEGPERIAPEWWRVEDDGAETRDYYRVEDESGGRYWLYRAGLYQAQSRQMESREAGRAPRWFLHGIFG